MNYYYTVYKLIMDHIWKLILSLLWEAVMQINQVARDATSYSPEVEFHLKSIVYNIMKCCN